MEHPSPTSDRSSRAGAAREREEGTAQKPGFAEEALPHLEVVYQFALRLTRGNAAEAEDLVQDTYLRAYRSWETFTRGTQCRSWLFTICRNAAIRRGEGKAHELEHLATDLGVDDVTDFVPAQPVEQGWGCNPESHFFDRQLDREVEVALDGLPREYRDAVVLCDVEGYAYGEIAQMLGVAGGTIKSRIHRGRQQLRSALRAYAVEAGHLRPGVTG